MKKNIIIILTIISLFTTAPAIAGGCKLEYKLEPGQKWLCSFSSKNQSNVMGNDSTNVSKKVYAYTVSKGPKTGWVTMTARIQDSGDQGGIDLSKLVFTAEVHTSGEIRNIQYSGDVMPDMGEDAGQIPAQMMEMMRESYKMIPEAYKNSIFWFPEVPEDKLEIGDEFEVKRNIGMGSSGMGVQMETVSLQVFTLEDVSKGLAYFSVKDRSITETKGVAGDKTETKISGKGDAIFDLEQGMWLELTEKSRAKMDLGGLAGMGSASQEMDIILEFEMELQ